MATRRDPDRLLKCAACETRMDVSGKRFFICMACLSSLPDEVRRGVLNTDGGDDVHARVNALRFLGAKDIYDVRVPRKMSDVRDESCSHEIFDFFDQPNFITGRTDKVCNKCGRVRYAEGAAR